MQPTTRIVPEAPAYANVQVPEFTARPPFMEINSSGQAFLPNFTAGNNTNSLGENGSSFLGDFFKGGSSSYTPNGAGGWNVTKNLSGFDKFNAGLQTLGSALSAFNGYKQTKLAKEQFNFQKDSFNKQYEAQRGLVNSQMSDRQARREQEAVANRSGPVMSRDEYMDKYGVK